MRLGIVGLGKMGLNLGLNLKDQGFDVKGFDVNAEVRAQASAEGLSVYDGYDLFFDALGERRTVWVMVPAGDITQSVLDVLFERLDAGDIVIEGGNSRYTDSVRRAERFEAKGIHYLDVGTSGGTSGARNGACLMIGGNEAAFKSVEPLFKAIAESDDAYLYAGAAGAGHFLKMVHNGVEYGMMQAIGEGFHLLEASDYDFDNEAVARVWNNGSVIRSWLIELAENMFRESPKLEEYRGIVGASGEGQWTVETALEKNVAVPVIALSVMTRSLSQETDAFQNKVLAGLRNQFGGHSFAKKEEE
ncbi:MAG: decarboxylating 6-phosphogluconate dehydrogenase [Turicibacter sp.]|nr:decarboxylating 6-phosphogluconate dehydrogenase [Turicibacter sp.]